MLQIRVRESQKLIFLFFALTRTQYTILKIKRQNQQFEIGLTLFDLKQFLVYNGDIVHW